MWRRWGLEKGVAGTGGEAERGDQARPRTEAETRRGVALEAADDVAEIRASF